MPSALSFGMEDAMRLIHSSAERSLLDLRRGEQPPGERGEQRGEAESANAETACELLALRAKDGDREAFGVLVTRHGDRIYNFLLRMTGHAHDAEDLAQDTFLRAYRGLQRHGAPRRFLPWLYTIARRTALNHFRAAKPTVEVPENLPCERDGSNPRLCAVASDRQASLWKMARRLKKSQFEALWLRYGEGLSLREVAEAMDTNMVYVKVLLHRARNRMATWLEGSELDPRREQRKNWRNVR